MAVVSCQWQLLFSDPAMARVKNAGGGPGDEDQRRPPRLPTDPKGKATKKLATRKWKYLDAETARAAVVAEAAE